jgi:hypothetical protein
MAEIAIAVFAAFAGFTCMIWVLLLWVGDGAVDLPDERFLDPILGARDPIGIYRSDEPFIPMPTHLRTRQEMVAWMTGELPKLTEKLAK